jgi:hypothetical protein
LQKEEKKQKKTPSGKEEESYDTQGTQEKEVMKWESLNQSPYPQLQFVTFSAAVVGGGGDQVHIVDRGECVGCVGDRHHVHVEQW